MKKFIYLIIAITVIFLNGCGTSDDTGNKLPVADAGADITVIQNELITFDANRSYDPDGNIVNYEWFCPDFNISIYSGPNSTHTIPAGRPVGDYNTKLIVTDDKNATTVDYVIVSIIAPRFLANAGENFRTIEDDFFTLDANESFYLDGNIISYEWLYIDNNQTLYKGIEQRTQQIQADRPIGNYDIKLIITNDKGETAEDIVTIYIEEADNNQFVDIYSTDITIAQFKELKQLNTVYIDVRTQGELDTGVIEGSYTIINPNGIGVWLQNGSEFLELVTDKDQSFTILCSTSSRAAGVANALKDNGYTHVHYLIGGIDAWRSAGEPLVLN